VKGDLNTPRLILHSKRIVSIAAGRYHSLALTCFGALYSWGCGENGQLGISSDDSSFLPRVVTPILGTVVGQIAAGEHHTVALSAGAPWGKWGKDVAEWLIEEKVETEIKEEWLRKTRRGLTARDLTKVEEEMKKWRAKEKKRRKQIALEEKAETEKAIQSVATDEQLQMEVKSQPQFSSSYHFNKSSDPANDNGNEDSQSNQRLSFPAITDAKSYLGEEETDVDLPSPSSTSLHLRSVPRDPSGLEMNREKKLRKGIEKEKGLMKSATAPTLRFPPLQPTQPSTNGGLPSGELQTESAISLMQLAAASASASASASAANAAASNERSVGGGGGGGGVEENFKSGSQTSRRDRELAKTMAFYSSASASGSMTARSYPRSSIKYPSPSSHQHRHSASTGSVLPTTPTTTSTNLPSSTSVLPSSPSLLLSSSIAPLARTSFLKDTSAMIRRMAGVLHKKGEITNGTSEMTSVLNTLQQCRREFDQIKDETRLKNKKAIDLKRELSLLHQQTTHSNDHFLHYHTRLSALKMQLNTVTIKIAEAEENRRNYELNISHLKEEDFEHFHSLQSLRKQEQELQQFINKLLSMKTAAMEEKYKSEQELINFRNEILNYQHFVTEQLAEFNSILSLVKEQNDKREKIKIERKAKATSAIAVRIEQLTTEVELAKTQSETLATRLHSLDLKLRHFENCFGKLTSATGLSNPDEIINKFYLKSEIQEQLKKEYETKSKHFNELKQKEEELMMKITTLNSEKKEEKWKTIELQHEIHREIQIQKSKDLDQFEKLITKCVFIQEGIEEMKKKLDKYRKEKDKRQKLKDIKDEKKRKKKERQEKIERGETAEEEEEDQMEEEEEEKQQINEGNGDEDEEDEEVEEEYESRSISNSNSNSTSSVPNFHVVGHVSGIWSGFHTSSVFSHLSSLISILQSDLPLPPLPPPQSSSSSSSSPLRPSSSVKGQSIHLSPMASVFGVSLSEIKRSLSRQSTTEKRTFTETAEIGITHKTDEEGDSEIERKADPVEVESKAETGQENRVENPSFTGDSNEKLPSKETNESRQPDAHPKPSAAEETKEADDFQSA